MKKKRTGGNGFELIDFPKRCHFSWEGNELRPKKRSSFSLAACETVPAAGSLHGAEYTGQFPYSSEKSAFTHTRFLQPKGKEVSDSFPVSVRMIIHRWLRTAER